ncbi:hypothetical protein [Microlunatus parietis]|uniref:Uncharacterized protein n=1 Tax=Microlunatus parietis TaxID=682979 RepID=A0A7Y9I6Z3_9ACTN|nr:hypothetical protein [Microlunatus parietis]NYE71200.1 hypothetical protein [Microlunatus parietis]
MPNGKPGDHPLTDILVHGFTVFGSELDGLIREIDDLGGTEELAREVNLMDFDPRFGADVADRAELRDRLITLRNRLRAG